MTQLPTKKDSLGQLLEKLAPIDDLLPAEEFDPEVVVGDIREKIDGINFRLKDWEAKEKMIRATLLKVVQQRIKALKGKREKLIAYVKDQMVKHDFDKLPGLIHRAQLSDSKGKLITDFDPLFQHYKAYPKYVKQVVTYEWIKDALREDLEAGIPLSFARIEPGKTLNFYGQESIEISGEITDDDTK
jgi:hypothetical protein